MTADIKASNSKRPRLAVVQRRLTHYRLPFFEGVRRELDKRGIDFTLAHGDPTPEEREKRDEGQLDWAVHLPCTYALGGRLCWQPLNEIVKQHDFIVVTQENKMLNNIPLLMGRSACRVALWGHGRNFQAAQARTAGIAQRIKAALSRRADWWFAYTSISAEMVESLGYPTNRITVLNNSIDTAALSKSIAVARLKGRAALREAYQLPAAAPLGLYLGSLYAEKRLDLLIDGALEIRNKHPDFHLAIVGSGPDAVALQRRVAQLPWVHMLGSRRGEEKAELLAAADVMLNPGLVGLGILDAFVAGLPIVTTDCNLHSPEIAYLEQGINGLMSEPTATGFSESVGRILSDEILARQLREGATRSADAYSLQAMVHNFCEGALRWQHGSLIDDAEPVQ